MARPDDATVRALAGRSLAIRDLLLLWDFKVRNHASVPQIELALANVGLTTAPHFAIGSLNNEVDIVPLARGEVQTSDTNGVDIGAEQGGIDGIEDAEESVGMFPQAAMRVHDLSCAHEVTSIDPDEPLPRAMSKMSEHGYSQLPVIDIAGELHGVITWASIAHMHATGRNPCLAHAISSEYEIVNAAAHLLPVLPLFEVHEFVLVRASDGRVSGIVTSADLAGQFGTVARPFFTLGEIERRLRRCLGRVYEVGDIQQVHKKKQSVEEMMFGEYIRLLNHGERWNKLGWPGVDRESFLGLLARVKDIRNTVMHFNASSLTPEQLDLLDRFVGMLRLYDPDYRMNTTGG